MSKEVGANKSLEDYVNGWALDSGVPELSETWLNELRKCGIGNLEGMATVAQYASDWEKLIEKIGPPLSSHMRKWHTTNYAMKDNILPMFPLIDRPSSATSEVIQGRLDDATVLMHHECVWALCLLLQSDTFSNQENEFTACAAAFFDEYSNMQDRTQLTGIFGQRIAMTYNEISKSSSLAAHLQNYLPHFQSVDLMWYHQFEDLSGGKMDIMLAGTPKNAAKTVYAVIETAKDSQNKHWQALSYGNNVSWFLNSADQLFYVVELGFDRKISINACTCKKDRLASAFIWEGDYTVENLAKMLFVLVHCTLQEANQFQSLGPNCVFDSRTQKVCKVFDYRKRLVSEENRRKPCEFYITFLGATKEVEVADFVIIGYPFVFGGNIPSKCSDFVGILAQLASMHAKSFVHGDIRLSNMIFTTTGKSTLIDFDFTGRHGLDKYPHGFAQDLVDTVRHSEAKGGQLLRVEHDLFSMASVMELFACSNGEWEKICEAVRCGKLIEVISFLGRMSDQIMIKAHIELHLFGTGSPKEYQKKRLRGSVIKT